MGDFNSKVGNEKIEGTVGPHGIGDINSRGERLVECVKRPLLQPYPYIKTALEILTMPLLDSPAARRVQAVMENSSVTDTHEALKGNIQAT
ncbi:craniofacial development protein 2-like [Elysia marginata]|uniref:Craniofacial development protein 2-like n=1 Tax=Elysia marginata TaxID=1093978 RepID=A0AAV4IZ62_9GAST|nr:craniofacial development protein 2-like [Elysia marginata]